MVILARAPAAKGDGAPSSCSSCQGGPWSRELPIRVEKSWVTAVGSTLVCLKETRHGEK